MPVLYDHDCGFCRFSIGVLLAWDRRRRLRPVAIQSEEGQRLLEGLPPSERLATAHAIDAEGRVRSGGAAAGPVLDKVPLGRPLAALVERSPSLADRAYHGIARRRSTLGSILPRGTRRWADRLISERGAG